MKSARFLWIAFNILCLVGCNPSISDQDVAKTKLTSTTPPTLTITAAPMLSESPTLVTESFGLTATPIPSPTHPPTPAPTATLPEISAMPMTNLDYGVSWSVPVGWQDISAEWQLPTDNTLFWSAWANEADASMLLAASPLTFPKGLMVATLHIAPIDGATPPPLGTRVTSVWGQSLWFYELEGAEAAPFSLRLVLSATQSPYAYTFSLDCAAPDGATAADQATFIASCRHIWDFISFDFGSCAIPVTPTPSSNMWQVISNESYQYAFEIPISWLMSEGTPDNLIFFSVPIDGQPQFCPLPDKFMKLEFFAEPPGNFAEEGQSPEEGTPDLEGAMAITLGGQPAWLFLPDGETAEEEGGNFSADITLVYIQGPTYWYTFTLYCSPEWTADCQKVLDHTLGSFQIQSS